MTIQSKLSFIERQQETLRAYIDGPLRHHFLSKEYIDGLCEQRNALFAKQAKAVSSLFLFTTVLTFFDYFSGQTVTAFGLTIVIAPIFAAVLCLVVSSLFFASVMATIDVLLIDAYLRTIGQTAGLYSFDLYTAHRTSINLWASAITPKYFGPVSPRSHHWAFASVGIVMLLVTLIFTCFPTVVCALTVVEFLQDNTAGWGLKVYVMTAALLLAFSWLFLILFALKYGFKPSDFRESDHEPTPDFVARTEAELKHK